MKIPETSANVGAYYGNEENGQWQPNGVIIDNGVGGGIVGSGDAGVHRAPVYPVHIPRHMPGGYVMAGAFYPPQFAPPAPPQPDDFEDYMWMENEEEFDKQVIQQLQEEELMEQCIEAMLEDENRERRGGNQRGRDPQAPTTSSCNGNPSISLEEAVSKSTLNPLAAEFVPTRIRIPPSTTSNTDIKAEKEAPSTEAMTNTDAASDPDRASKPEPTEQAATEAPLTPPKDPPEVSAADPLPIKDVKSKPRDVKKPPAKVEVKKLKPVVVKSEPKVPSKRKEAKEVKTVKSEAKVEEAAKTEDTADIVPKPQPPTPTEEAFPGLKPINYAAAAKASKPKSKAASPPAPTPTPAPVEKPQPAVDKKREEKKPLKDKPKEKPVQRKNSAK